MKRQISWSYFSSLADGSKIPPLVIFKKKTLPKTVAFPSGVLVRINKKGWMNEHLVIDWMKNVWLKRRMQSLKSLFWSGICSGHTAMQK